MRIISEHYDYYDAIQREGQDLSLVYVRKPTTLHYGPDQKNHWPFRQLHSSDTRIWTYVVGFCGKLYPVIKIWEGSKVSFCFDAEQTLTTLERVYIRLHWYGNHRSDMVNYFERFKGDNIVGPPHSLFAEHKCPIFVAVARGGNRYGEGEVIINGNLKQTQFYRIFDPYRAFQEIAMYLGNQAQPNKPIPEIDDKTMCEIKGFDPKWSFRKPPSKEKR